MIETGKYQRILDEGLLLDHYVVLCALRDGKELPKSKRVQGFLNLLHKKGYIDEGVLTDKGTLLISADASPIILPAPVKVEKVKEGEFDYADWVIQLHRKLQAKLIEKTGKRQVRDKINGVGAPYAFLPNPTDLGNQLLKVINTYKLRDFDKIEQCLLKYTEDRARAKSWFPVLYYYILKDKASRLVTDLEAMDVDEEQENDDQIVNI